VVWRLGKEEHGTTIEANESQRASRLAFGDKNNPNILSLFVSSAPVVNE
jgi:hypothetical protein